MVRWLFLLGFCVSLSAQSQFRQKTSLPSYQVSMPATPILKKLPFGLVEDAAQNIPFQSPTLTALPMADANHKFQMQWISSVSSLSFNNGKFGSYYYWDVSGNLIDTRGFIDIAGKKKRGLKLVFPWR
jgi:hypothetical protein